MVKEIRQKWLWANMAIYGSRFEIRNKICLFCFVGTSMQICPNIRKLQYLMQTGVLISLLIMVCYWANHGFWFVYFGSFQTQISQKKLWDFEPGTSE